jgi:hypothetical protein
MEFCGCVGGISVYIQGGPEFKFQSGDWLSKEVSESVPTYAGIGAQIKL